jgi:hypothetical protein
VLATSKERLALGRAEVPLRARLRRFEQAEREVGLDPRRQVPRLKGQGGAGGAPLAVGERVEDVAREGRGVGHPGRPEAVAPRPPEQGDDVDAVPEVFVRVEPVDVEVLVEGAGEVVAVAARGRVVRVHVNLLVDAPRQPARLQHLFGRAAKVLHDGLQDQLARAERALVNQGLRVLAADARRAQARLHEAVGDRSQQVEAALAAEVLKDGGRRRLRHQLVLGADAGFELLADGLGPRPVEGV